MAQRAPSQVRVETLVARGRLVLGGFALLAARLSALGGRSEGAAVAVTIAFTAYAVLLLLVVRTRAGSSPRYPGATHAIDLAAYTAYLSAATAASPAVLAWFLFALVAATLRWGWRGALTTGSIGIAAHVAFGAHAAEYARDPAGAARQFILLALLMGVVTILVGLVGAYEDWRGAQLARLAAWAGPDPDRPTELPADMLAQASEVLEAPRTLLVWEELDEPWTEVAIWDKGRTEQTREPPGSLGEVVVDRVGRFGFFCRDVTHDPPVTFVRGQRGLESWQGLPIDPALRERFSIRAVAAWPLGGDSFRGWLFCLDRPAFSLQDLAGGGGGGAPPRPTASRRGPGRWPSAASRRGRPPRPSRR
jgi:hypothetical protein